MNFDAQQVVAILKKKQGARTNKEFAEQIGVTPAYLGDVYFYRRTLGPKILSYIGLKKITLYQQENSASAKRTRKAQQ